MDFQKEIESIRRKDENKVTFIPFEEAWNLIVNIGLTPLFDFIRGKRVLTNGEKLFNNNIFMNVYTLVYDLSTQKGQYEFSSKVYEAQKNITEQFFIEIFNEINNNQNDLLFVKAYLNYWNLFETVFKRWMCSFFIYIQRFYINTNKLPDMKSQLTLQFKENIFEPCKTRLMNFVANEINYYRDHDNEITVRGDIPKLSNLMEIFTKLILKDDSTMYSMYFESYLYEFSREYFQNKVTNWRSQYGNIEYCQVVNHFRLKEEERMIKFFESSSHTKLMNIYIEESIKKIHRDILLHQEQGIAYILTNKRWDDLQVFYNIMSLIPKDEGLKDFANVYGEHIQNNFMNDLSNIRADNNNSLMNEVSVKFMQIYELYQEIIQKRLRNHTLFLEALRSVTKTTINKVFENFKFYDAFPIYLDTIMKVSGDKIADNEQICNIIQKVIEVVNFIADKDIFVENCRIHLAKRIYEEKIKDDEIERTLITAIKLNFGNSYVIKMIGMLNDYLTSKSSIEEFKVSPFNNNPFEFTPYVFTRAHWPTFPRIDITVPRAIREAQDNYAKYYDAVHSKRQLTWNYTIGKMTIQIEFANNQNRDLRVNTIQGIIIYLFEEEGVEHTIQSIFDKTQIPIDFIKRALHSMACRKIKILNKTGTPEDINDSDVFTFNYNFTYPKRVVVIPCPPFEERNVQAIVKEDRSIQIEAAIVRIMKVKKTYEHGPLISEVLTQLRMFSPEPKIIKKKIEDLIDKEYLERHKDKPNVYIYLA